MTNSENDAIGLAAGAAILKRKEEKVKKTERTQQADLKQSSI